MPFRRTLYVGVGDVGVRIVGSWMDYVRHRMPQVWPLVSSVGLLDHTSSQSPEPAVRSLIQEGQSLTRIVPWVYRLGTMADPILQDVAGTQEDPSKQGLAPDLLWVVRLLQQEFARLGGVVPPQGWRLAAVPDLPRVVLVAQLHDGLFKRLARLAAGRDRETPVVQKEGRPDASGGDVLSAIWHHVMRAVDSAAGSRDLQVALLVDAPRGADGRDLLRELEAHLLREIVSPGGAPVLGVNIALISHLSRKSAAHGRPVPPMAPLWDTQNPWDSDYVSAVERYVHSYFAVLASSSGTAGDPLYKNGCLSVGANRAFFFSTPCLFHFDDQSILIQRYAVFRQLASELGRLHASGVPHTSELDEPEKWIQQHLDVDESTPAPQCPISGSIPDVAEHTAQVLRDNIAKEKGDLRPHLEHLRMMLRTRLADLKGQIERIQDLFKGAPGEWKAKWDRALVEERDRTKAVLEEKIVESLNEGGFARTEERLSRLMARLDRTPQRYSPGFEWPPPEQAPYEDRIKELESRIDRLDADSGLENIEAVHLHVTVASAGAAIGMGAAVDVVWFLLLQWWSPLLPWLRWAFVPLAALLTFVAVRHICLRGLKNARARRFQTLMLGIARNFNAIEAEIDRCGLDLKAEFEKTWRELYRLRRLRYLLRLVRNKKASVAEVHAYVGAQCRKYSEAADALQMAAVPQVFWYRTVAADQDTLGQAMNGAVAALKNQVTQANAWSLSRSSAVLAPDDLPLGIVDRELNLLQLLQHMQEAAGPMGKGVQWGQRLLEAVQRFPEGDDGKRPVSGWPALPLRAAEVSSNAPVPGDGSNAFLLYSSQDFSTQENSIIRAKVCASLAINKAHEYDVLLEHGQVFAAKLFFHISADSVQADQL